MISPRFLLLIWSGSHGAPPNGNLLNNSVLLKLETDGKLRSYKGLDLLHLIKTMVHYCRIGNLQWDPREAILFLCQHYGEEIRTFQSQLNQKAVQQDFLASPFVQGLPFHVLRKCYQILLGTEPPPTMAITPPTQPFGHKYSASASDATGKPRASSQQMVDLLRPPTQKKAKTALPLPSNGSHPSSGLAVPQSTATGMVAELASGERDSRARYRPVNALNSRKVSPTGLQPTTTKSIDAPNLPRLPTTPTAKSGLPHNVPLSSHLVPAPMLTTSKRSMPNLHAGTRGPIAPYAFAKTPLLFGAGQLNQQQSQKFSPMEMSATPVLLNPGQHHLKSQLGLAGYDSQGVHPANNMPITERPQPPYARASYHAPSLIRSELSGTSVAKAQGTKQQTMSTGGQLRNTLNQSTTGKSPEKAPQLVGPEGLYEPREGSNSAIHFESEAITAGPTKRRAVTDGLDAVLQLGQYISELSAERKTPSPKHYTSQQSQHATPIQMQDPSFSSMISGRITTSAVQDSPVHLPDNGVSQDLTIIEHEDIRVRPLNIRAQSAPLAALPASLTVGGSASQQSHQRRSTNTNQLLTTAPAQNAPPKTNASRYTRYYAAYSPPAPTLNSTNASPQPIPASAYKAYQPPLPSPSIPLPSPSERESRPTTFAALKDVDGSQGYFKQHKRDKSHDSQASNASHDSGKLAQEYQAELPDFEGGYGGAVRA